MAYISFWQVKLTLLGLGILSKEYSMNEAQREQLVYRIMSGETYVTVKDIDYKLVSPSIEIKYQSSQLYSKTLKDNRFEPWMSILKCKNLLIANKLCELNIDINIVAIEKRIEDLKVELLDNMLDTKAHTKTKKMIKLVKDKYNQMLVTRHSYDHLTADGFAETVKQEFIVCNTLHYTDGRRVWESMDQVDSPLLEAVLRQLHNHIVEASQVREAARTEPWRGFWNIDKSKTFNFPTPELTSSQQALVMFSKMYDSVKEHPECPPDDIVNNDDLFDGWMIRERRKEEGEKTKADIEKRVGKERHAKADEMFIMAKGNTPEERRREAEEIHKLNDPHAQIVKAQRAAVTKKRGTAVDAHFLDRQVQRQTELNTMFKENAKGNK